MKRIVTTLVLGLAVSAAPSMVTTAQAQPQAQVQIPRQSSFDARGWTLLGEKRVDSARDRDTIRVGRQEGRFTKLAIVVEDSDAELFDMTVSFGNGQRFSPDVKQTYREGSRAKIIDLPGEARFINRIDFRYGGLPGGGKARVQVWAKEEVGPPARPSGFDPIGWTFLGEKRVDGWQDHDRIKVPPQFGQFDKLMLVVEDGDLELQEFNVVYGRNERFSPDLRQVYRDGSRSRQIDLPSATSGFKAIEMRYRNVPGNTRPARIQVWAKDASAPPPPVEPGWDPKGWSALGAVNVNPALGQQQMEGVVGRGRFGKLAIQLPSGSLDLTAVTINFPDGRKATQNVRHSFAEGSRTLTLDLPNNDGMQSILFRFGRDRGAGKAKLFVYGLPAGSVSAPAPVPPQQPIRVEGALDTRAWANLGAINVKADRTSDRLEGVVGRGKYSRLAIVAKNGELDLDGVVVTFADGTTLAPSFKHHFRDGGRAVVIDLPANKPAATAVDVRYGNDRGAGRTRLEVFGLK